MNDDYPLIIENFISEEDSEYLIRVFDRLQAEGIMKKRTDSGSMDGRQMEWNPQRKELDWILRKYAYKIGHNNITGEVLYPHDIAVQKYDVGVGMGRHTDSMDACVPDCKISAVMYLNDNYEGGKVGFPNVNKEFSPPKNSVMMFPQQSSQWDHEVGDIISGSRYVIVTCFTSVREKATEHYMWREDSVS